MLKYHLLYCIVCQMMWVFRPCQNCPLDMEIECSGRPFQMTGYSTRVIILLLFILNTLLLVGWPKKETLDGIFG